MQVFHTHTCILVHICTGLGYLHTFVLHLDTYTCILTLGYFYSSVSVEASVFKCKCRNVSVQVQVWKCQCVSVSVEVSVFKGFSGRTLRNAFGKK